jgi:hypothetical protein
VKRVTRALCARKKKFMRMPSKTKMEATAQRMLDRFGLPRFAFAVDGMMVRSGSTTF